MTNFRKNDCNILGIPDVRKLCAYWMYYSGHHDGYIANKLDCGHSIISNYRKSLGLKRLATGSNGKHVTWLAKNNNNINYTDKPWIDPESLYCDTKFLSKLLNKEVE